MDVTTRYAPGTPAWADIAEPDGQAAVAFYRAVFGWEFTSAPAEAGEYHVALARGRQAAGIMAQRDPEAPVMWLTYLATDDLDATLAAVERAGGMVTAPVFDVGEQGRGAVVADPTGAVVGVWQAGTHIGANVVNEPGAITWNELETQDSATAAAFYRAVFGVEVADAGMGFDYSLLKVADRPVGGLYDGAENLPEGVSARWLTYFQVADTDTAVASAVAAGGEVARPAEDTPFGRMARLRDPWGGEFAVISPAETGQPG